MSENKFQIEQQETEDAYLLNISGELDLSVAPQLRTALESVVNRSDKALIMDVKNLKYIDSTGIGIIVSALKIRDELKAPFNVRNIPSSIQRLFDLTGISVYLK
ncbi:MAG: anti-sigma-factor antagonist [Bacilli bacterium]|nr:anti-sigma-factor antagonist [Bacilli bacterium]